MNPTFVKPRYDSGGFAGIPRMITGLLGGEPYALPFEGINARYDNVILFFIDGFGWRHVENFGEEPFLKRFFTQGRTAKLTSQFPSTTSGHVTCIHTGQTVGQSGVFEWNYYEPLLDAMIVPLLFSFSGTTEREQLKSTKVDPRQLYPTQTIYHNLNRLGVTSTVFQHREFTPSTYSNIMFGGATKIHGFRTLSETLVNLKSALAAAEGPNYFFFYYDKIDSVSHDYGPASAHTAAEIDAFMTVLERQFMDQVKPRGRTLLLLTADHGQSEVDPRTTVYLNRAFPGIEQHFRTGRKGRSLVPGGSCRDMFLYVKDEELGEVETLLTDGLAGIADVVRTESLIDQGYFGPEVSDTFRARAGNLVILPARGESVWWYEKDRFEQRFYGHHGGLTPQEMEIPLLALEL
jgi:predicted AlkP superfamily pyrophosphatase or phosphodiesterase